MAFFFKFQIFQGYGYTDSLGQRQSRYGRFSDAFRLQQCWLGDGPHRYSLHWTNMHALRSHHGKPLKRIHGRKSEICLFSGEKCPRNVLEAWNSISGLWRHCRKRLQVWSEKDEEISRVYEVLFFDYFILNTN